MRASAAALALALAACRAPAPPAAAPGASRAVAAPREAAASPAWEVFPAGVLSGAVRDVAALDGGEAVVIAGGAIVLWRSGDRAERVCELGAGDDPRAAQAEGDRFVVIGGDEADPVAWRSDDRGARCERVRVPPLSVRDTPRAPLALSLHGATAHAWTSSGGLARSDDGGRTWRRLPTLRGLLEVAPGPRGSTLAAATVGYSGERPRARLYALDRPDGAWEPVEGAEHLRGPVSLQPLDDGRTAAADALGTLALDAQLAVTARRLDPAARHPSRSPAIVAPAGEGRFLAAARSLLLAVDGDATAAVAALPGLRDVRAIDASRDGWLWASDGRGLWRGRFDGPLVEASSQPLAGEEPVALAARGSRVLVAGAGRAAALRDAGAWRAMALPETVGRPLAAHVDDAGALFVLGVGGVAVSDAGEFAALPGPGLNPASGAAVRFAAVGDRWLVAAAAVLTSDDHGARWEARFGRAPATAVTGPQHGAQAAPWLAAHALRGDALMALDSSRALWRSDDAGASFQRVGAALPPPGGGPPEAHAYAVLAWDGGARVAVLARDAAMVSSDGGRTFATAVLPFAPRWAAFSGATLVASGAMSHLLPRECRNDPRQSLFVLTPDGWVADPDACAARGALLAQDGDAVWLLDESMTLRRASLARLVRAVAGL